MSEIRRNIDLTSVVPQSANVTFRWVWLLVTVLPGFGLLLSFSCLCSTFRCSSFSYCLKD